MNVVLIRVRVHVLHSMLNAELLITKQFALVYHTTLVMHLFVVHQLL